MAGPSPESILSMSSYITITASVAELHANTGITYGDGAEQGLAYYVRTEQCGLNAKGVPLHFR
jgi:hypothetical protein